MSWKRHIMNGALNDLLKVAGSITLHTPLNKYTQDLINATAVSLIREQNREHSQRSNSQ